MGSASSKKVKDPNQANIQHCLEVVSFLRLNKEGVLRFYDYTKEHKGDHDLKRLKFWYKLPKEIDLDNQGASTDEDFSNSNFLKEFISGLNPLTEAEPNDQVNDTLLADAVRIDNHIQELKGRMLPNINQNFADFQKYLRES